jgi:hypothetical protein
VAQPPRSPAQPPVSRGRLTRARRLVRCLSRTLLLAALVLATALLGPSAVASADAADYQTVYTSNGTWRAQINAWTTNLIAYKSIGATITVEHREWVCSGVFCTDGHHWHWVRREAVEMDVYNTYEPFPPSGVCRVDQPNYCVPPAPPRSCEARGASTIDCFDWGVMFAYSSNSIPRPGTAQLNIKEVQSRGAVRLPDGQVITLGPVENSFWF